MTPKNTPKPSFRATNPLYTPDRRVRLRRVGDSPDQFWAGDPERPAVQAVHGAAEDFRLYVNALLDAFGHLPYEDLLRRAAPAAPAGHDEADPSYD